MPTRFPPLLFENPKRARLNWCHIEKTLPRDLISVLATRLRSSPDPDNALNYFERFSSTASSKVLQYLTRNIGALNILIPIFSQSHYLSETFLLYPEYIEWLHRDKRIEFIKSKEDLLEELSRFEGTSGTVGLAEQLVRFKRREYLRIAFRDIAKISTLAETAAELSMLADIVLEKALRHCDQKLRNRFGSPQFIDENGRVADAGLVIMALGKLGGNELNYSSDIDLLFIYSHDGETKGIDPSGETRISNQEYFIKLAGAVNETVSGVTPSGWAFRVDLRLRPQGREGFLSRSMQSTVDYYRHSAEPWELQALLKARAVAGDLDIGKQLLRSLQEKIYPSEEKSKIVGSIGQMRHKLDDKLSTSDSPGFNVKLARGTIRDVEFITQCLQRLNGAQDEWVREANTLHALRRLHDNDHLSLADFVTLASAYEFFRVIEHRLQLDRGQQTHRIPADVKEQRLLALRVGFEDSPTVSAQEALLHSIEYHQEGVQRIYRRILEWNDGQKESSQTLSPPGEYSLSFDVEPSTTAAPHTTSPREFDPRWEAMAQSPVRWKSQYLSFWKELSGLSTVAPSTQEIPLAVESLQILFNSGLWVAEMSARHPDWVLNFLNRRKPPRDKTKKGKRKGSSSTRLKPAQKNRAKPAELSSVNQLRAGIRQNVFEVLANDVLKSPPVPQTLQRLSQEAEKAIRDSLSLSIQQAHPSVQKILKDRAFHFGVFALGRLATHELDVGSDLDLVFVCDYSCFRSPDAVREAAWRLAEAVISILTSYTREGALYSTDLRLRPNGREGELVQDAVHWMDYFRTSAQTWEHMVHLKLRPVAGDLRWANGIKSQIHKMSLSSGHSPSLKNDVLGMRTRLEQASTASSEQFDFKQGSGGMYDIEFALAYAHLVTEIPYRTGSTLVRALESKPIRALLSKSSAEIFIRAAVLYRAIDHAIRLLRGQALSVVDRNLLEALPSNGLHRIPTFSGRKRRTHGGLQNETIGDLLELCRKTAVEVRQAMNEVLGKPFSSGVDR